MMFHVKHDVEMQSKKTAQQKNLLCCLNLRYETEEFCQKTGL